MWGNIPDRSIRNVLEGIESGQINPDTKTFVFRCLDGRSIGIDSTSEMDARSYGDYHGLLLRELIKTDPMTINGMTIEEIKIEAEKRGIING